MSYFKKEPKNIKEQFPPLYFNIEIYIAVEVINTILLHKNVINQLCFIISVGFICNC
jgi:hypothetical protein